jgi:pteridine reductase
VTLSERTAQELLGRTALVTGAAVRLGRAIALELGRAGADVVLHCHSHRSEAEAVASELCAMGRRSAVVQADLSRAEEVSRLFVEADRFGSIDALVLSAGVMERTPIGRTDPSQVRRLLDVNLVGPMLCAEAAAHRMLAGKGGDIVTLCDVGGTSTAWKGYGAYCASKAGLAMLTRVLAVELAPAIRVNGVAPGAVLFSEAEDEETRRRVLSRVPQAREGEPDDVARTVRFLIGGPRYLTGVVIPVDGGRSAAG